MRVAEIESQAGHARLVADRETDVVNGQVDDLRRRAARGNDAMRRARPKSSSRVRETHGLAGDRVTIAPNAYATSGLSFRAGSSRRLLGQSQARDLARSTSGSRHHRTCIAVRLIHSSCSPRVQLLAARARRYDHSTTGWRDGGRDHRARPRAASHGVRARFHDGSRGGHHLEREGDRLRRGAIPARSALQPAARTAATSRSFRHHASRHDDAARRRRETSSAIIPGSDPALRGEYVAITAHNDHIGFTTARSITIRSARSTRSFARSAPTARRAAVARRSDADRAILDSVCARCTRRDPIRSSNGADDDGSGTIALIEIAEAFMQGRRQAAPLDPARVAHRRGRRGCSAPRGTPITRPCRSIRSSPNSTST